MSAPVAPGLDEIIGESDEEIEANAELLTPAELMDRLLRVWQNEKMAPVLLSAHPDLLGLVQEETDRLDTQAKSLPAGDLRAQLKRMQVERVRFVLTDYMRIRINKIEQFAEHILAEERSRPDGESPHLTAEEFIFAKTYTNSIKEYLKNAIVNRLPANMQTVKEEDLAFHPNPDGYVFCRAVSRVDSIEYIDNPGPDGQPRTTSLTLEPEDQYLLPYSIIQQYVDAGDVILL
ncbi:hypothetical protein EG68_00701 [Paragonimus skrjabini miyazakii]|uniref:DNA replication complex GINS protein SLD5 n=1 Tax=Paragonimus skrjabini miyazakii TaxID=59628 RepID=A0A8S9Z3E4_9TREM|nr:hypothetical protein EG68_00701 [Paragonimus skrjabini miyazakii]